MTGASVTTNWVYSFGDGKAQGRADMRNLLGGKGANLAEMSSLGLPVPPGFTITTGVCTWYYANGQKYPAELAAEVDAAIAAASAAGAQGAAAMGKVMAILKPRIAGRADIGAASALVRQRLAG
jgi:phosphoenolpyruvate synthase/pyruvate phosphate dikinase